MANASLAAAAAFLLLSGCISQQAGILDDEAILAEMGRLDSLNEYPANKLINPSDYPQQIGVHAKNGLPLMEKYFCSDVCPDYGAVYILYSGVNSSEQCAKIGGRDVIDPAWRGYIGCAPRLE